MKAPALPPAVVVRGLPHARAVLQLGRPATLLSAPDAGRYAGAGWWRALVAAAREARPDLDIADVLDCGAAPGSAMAALRAGQTAVVLAPCPALAAVRAAAAGIGAVVLDARPPAIDLLDRTAWLVLEGWLAGDTGRGLG